ncbi:MAG: LPS assembly protein LptD [Phycisphaera sp.]|nr:LPS assembly protein LptD [Phycisphaera sp.]
MTKPVRNRSTPHCAASRWTFGAARATAAIITALTLLTAVPSPAQQAAPAPATPAAPKPEPNAIPAGDSGRDIDRMIEYSATGLALPNVPIPASLEMKSTRANSWTAGSSKYVLLDGDVSIKINAYGLKADRAVAIITNQTVNGVEARHLGIYLDNVREFGGTPIEQEATRLLVTAVITGDVKLQTDDLSPTPKGDDPLVNAATDRLNRYLTAIAQNTQPLPGGPRLYDRERFVDRAVREAALTGEAPKLPPEVADLLPPDKRPPSMVQIGPDGKPIAGPAKPERTAQVDFNAGRIVGNRKEGYVLLVGDIRVLYEDPNTGRQLSLRADKAVIFTKPTGEGDNGPVAQSIDSGQIEGVYLEDNVIASDGQYTLRGPRMFYDLKTSRAVVLDAVFFTWDVERQIPLYVRAKELRQHSQHEWSATSARMTTSEFAEPHFSIGVNQVTIEADRSGAGLTGHHIKAENITLNAGKVPLFYWPEISGTAADVPLQSISVGGGSRRGATMETRWDLFNLLSVDKPTGVNASLLVDGYTKRGVGIGTNWDYDVNNAFGKFDAYYLYDRGTDEPGGREQVDPDSENRGRVVWRHRHLLPDNWEASIELAWLSDPTFLEEWYPDDANAEKEYETSIFLKQQRDDWAFTFLAKYDLLDFVPQNDVLQTRGGFGEPGAGYTVNKFPELAYHRIANSLWDDRLTWYSENRGSVMQINLPRDSPRDRGFSPSEITALYGMGVTGGTEYGTLLEGAGYDDSVRYRLDTRQELDAPIKLGPVSVVPYVVGRVTAYDDGFDTFKGDDGVAGNNDNIRLWGATGVKLHASFYSDHPNLENELFDVHGLRHIIEPSANLFFAATTIDQSDLPVYDYDVESLAEGGFVRIGVRNTFQTRRGGPGNWRNVDLLRIDTNGVIATGEPDRESPIARFFDYRPEMSLVGDHVSNEIAWQVTDTMAFVSNLNYSFEDNELVRTNLGITFDHTPRLTSFVMYRDIEPLSSSLLRYGFDYQLTSKYFITMAHSWDIEHGESRSVSLTLTRRLPRWLLIVSFDIDTVEDITSAGIALVPEGLGGDGNPGRNPFLFR